MSAEEIKMIAVAFPVAEPQRALMRRIMPELPLPALYRNGAENRPCSSCGMTLNVGPRILASGVTTIYCPICVTHLHPQEAQGHVMSLGNPESRWEE